MSTALIEASVSGNLEIVKELVENGAKLNIREQWKRRRDKVIQH